MAKNEFTYYTMFVCFLFLKTEILFMKLCLLQSQKQTLKPAKNCTRNPHETANIHF